MDTIVRFETFHRDGRLLFAFNNPSSVGDITLPTGEIADGPAVEARLNHGRWIADCPAASCPGAELVSFDEPVFFCCECRNAQWNHSYLPVLAPAEKERTVIETYIAARPIPANRNWQPGDTVKQLQEENRAAGIRLGAGA